MSAAVDPFVELIQLLRPRATLWRRVEAAGPWGLGFHKRDDVLSCWVRRGGCVLRRAGEEPVRLGEGDFVLVRTSAAFSLGSEVEGEVVDSEAVFQPGGAVEGQMGEGEEGRVTIEGGRFLFDTANEQLLTGLLPAVVRVVAGSAVGERVRVLLEMNAEESAQRRPGRGFVVRRLMELLLVEVLREPAGWGGAEPAVGLLAGMADPAVAVALRAMHGEVARAWTVEGLGRLAGMSRAAFVARFGARVGVGPIEYLQAWRMALAKEELRRGELGMGEVAFRVGFQSVSAFSTAFRRRVGASPRAYATEVRARAGR